MSRHVRFLVPVRDSSLDRWLDLREKLPPDTNLILVCKQHYSIEPLLILLPHQLREETVRKFLKDLVYTCGDSIVVYPLRSCEAFPVATTAAGGGATVTTDEYSEPPRGARS